MRYLKSAFAFLLLFLAGCGNDTITTPEDEIDAISIESSSSSQDSPRTKDTVVISKLDTTVLMLVDTVFMYQKDTVFSSKLDTTVISTIDTFIVSKMDTIAFVPAPDTGTGILDFNPESEMIPKLENLIHQKKDPTYLKLQAEQIVLLHFTDLHGDEENLERIKEFYDYYSKYIDVVVHTGDAVQSKWASPFDFWEKSGAAEFLNVLGNHEIVFNGEDISQQQVYARYFAPFISKWDAISPANAESEGLMYYYKDIDKGTLTERAKLRLIILDEFHWNDAQMAWFQNVLDDAKANDFAVLICRHKSAPITKYENCPFVTLENFKSADDIQSLPDAEDAVDKFIAEGGEFVMWLGGHHHQDIVGTIQGHPNQVVFNAESSGMIDINWNNSWRKRGSKSQDCFTLIGIDRFEKIIRFIRIGADRDRYERKKETMSINYSTAKMIY